MVRDDLEPYHINTLASALTVPREIQAIWEGSENRTAATMDYLPTFEELYEDEQQLRAWQQEEELREALRAEGKREKENNKPRENRENARERSRESVTVQVRERSLR